MIAVAHGARLEARRVQPGIGLGHRKTGLFVAGDQRRQKPLFLLVGAKDDDRVQPENVHVDRRGAAEPGAGFGDGLHQDRGFGDAEPAAAISLRHRNAEPAGLGHRLMELVRKTALLVLFQPIFVAKARAQPRHGFPQLPLLGAQPKCHLIPLWGHRRRPRAWRKACGTVSFGAAAQRSITFLMLPSIWLTSMT